MTPEKKIKAKLSSLYIFFYTPLIGLITVLVISFVVMAVFTGSSGFFVTSFFFLSILIALTVSWIKTLIDYQKVVFRNELELIERRQKIFWKNMLLAIFIFLYLIGAIFFLLGLFNVEIINDPLAINDDFNWTIKGLMVIITTTVALICLITLKELKKIIVKKISKKKE